MSSLVTDEQIRAMDRSKMEPGAAAAHERIVDDTEPAVERPPRPGETPNEILEFKRPDEALVETQVKLAEAHESPEYKARERAIFEQQELPEDHRVFGDEVDGDQSIDEIRKQFKDDQEFLDSISSCGMGGS